MDIPKEPLYSFGYGLSYTTFEYSNLKLSKNTCTKDDTVIVSVDVMNTGKYDGKEIVQLYINDVVSSVVTPVKELKGFKKVEIKAGETKTVEIPLKISELAIVKQDESYVVELGEFNVMVGPDSREASLLKTYLTVIL
jgi:beta-glucosidase